MEGFYGEVRLFAGDFAPRGWAFCEGQLLPISSNQKLYDVIGATWGGNGTTTFALPDTRGRVVIGAGAGATLTKWQAGDVGGEEAVALTVEQMYAHNHVLTGSYNCKVSPPAYSDEGDTDDPRGNTVYALESNGESIYASTSDASMLALNDVSLDLSVDLANTGSGQPHNNMQAYTALQYIICIDGETPSKS
ncbi:MAG: tail fiber protein [Flavipsychrobacter sp.]